MARNLSVIFVFLLVLMVVKAFPPRSTITTSNVTQNSSLIDHTYYHVFPYHRFWDLLSLHHRKNLSLKRYRRTLERWVNSRIKFLSRTRPTRTWGSSFKCSGSSKWCSLLAFFSDLASSAKSSSMSAVLTQEDADRFVLAVEEIIVDAHKYGPPPRPKPRPLEAWLYTAIVEFIIFMFPGGSW